MSHKDFSSSYACDTSEYMSDIISEGEVSHSGVSGCEEASSASSPSRTSSDNEAITTGKF